MHWGYGGVGVWGAAFTTISMVLLWLLIIVVVISLLRSLLSGTRSAAARTPSRPNIAEQTLAERFARGDIDEEEYRRRLEALRSISGSGGASPP